MQLDPLQLAIVFLAGIAGGAINALAGGGTLLTFPVLTAVGIPAVSANVTNTVALVPGYVGGMVGQAADLRGQRRRLLVLIPAGVLGGLAGGLLLLATGERIFRELVPYLILFASGLLAIQEPLKKWIMARRAQDAATAGISEFWIVFPSFVIIALTTNVTAALLFVFSGEVVWLVAAVMAAGALGGGALGGRLAGRVKPATLRRTVVAIGVIVAIIYFVRG